MTRRLTGILLLTCTLTAGAQTPAAPDDTLEERIEELIRELGAEEFAIRERAQAELASLGLAAFDALNNAIYSDDIEIILRARYLLRSMRVQWFAEEDPPNVKRLLTEYGRQREPDRRSRIDRLGKMDHPSTLAALCRLARYETDPRLSKLAALRVMQRITTKPEQDALIIKRMVDTSQRPGAQWLTIYVLLLNGDPESLANWDDVIRDERQTLVSAATRTSLELVRDLSRWQVDQLRKHELKEQAVAAIRRSLELVDGSRDQVLENALWLMKLEAYPMVQELAERHPDYFNSLVKFKYLMAESQQAQGNTEAAAKAAAAALQLNADDHEEHIEAAVLLTDRGLTKWAAGEFEARIANNEEGSVVNLRSRFLYSEMLHDGELNDIKAAEVLQGAVKALEDPAAQQRARLSLSRDPNRVKSRMHYFFAIGKIAANKELDQARKHLEEAIQIYPEDPDVLIAMYHLPEQDEPWILAVKQRIDVTAKKFRVEIDQRRALLLRRTTGPTRQQYERLVSSLNNQYAWLVANTEGNYDDALKCSQQSLELTPDSPVYLDTLARCYFSVKDYANAVKHQQEAVDQIPHSKLMQRQLEQFKTALEKEPAVDMNP